MPDATEPSPLLVKAVQLFAPAILWFGRTCLQWNRLDHLTRVELGSLITEVVKIYGEPTESGPDKDFPEATTHTFQAGPFHEAVISEWQGKVCSITYWSSHASPTRDLKCMFETYGQGMGWHEIQTGYWYFRKDDKVRLWCSAIPAIGVATADFMEAKAQAKKANDPQG